MTNDQRAKEILTKYGFDFKKISRSDIRDLIEEEISNYHRGSSEYIRVLCGYLFCIGDASDIPLLKHSKYDINMDVGCMIDGDWIESSQNGGMETELIYNRKELIAGFIEYYKNFEVCDLEDEW